VGETPGRDRTRNPVKGAFGVPRGGGGGREPYGFNCSGEECTGAQAGTQLGCVTMELRGSQGTGWSG